MREKLKFSFVVKIKITTSLPAFIITGVVAVVKLVEAAVVKFVDIGVGEGGTISQSPLSSFIVHH